MMRSFTKKLCLQIFKKINNIWTLSVMVWYTILDIKLMVFLIHKLHFALTFDHQAGQLAHVPVWQPAREDHLGPWLDVLSLHHSQALHHKVIHTLSLVIMTQSAVIWVTNLFLPMGLCGFMTKICKHTFVLRLSLWPQITLNMFFSKNNVFPFPSE